jgi:putative SOS response-associated peptidase YedK
VPANGFYEWKADGSRKRPHFIRPRGGGLLAFAGLWECWMGPNGEEVETACIVTTTSNRALRDLHERMPVVIPEEAFDFWLDCAHVDAETAAALITPAPDDLFEFYEVSTAVNRTANDSAGLIAPLGSGAAPPEPPAVPRARPRSPAKPKTGGGQGSLF